MNRFECNCGNIWTSSRNRKHQKCFYCYEIVEINDSIETSLKRTGMKRTGMITTDTKSTSLNRTSLKSTEKNRYEENRSKKNRPEVNGSDDVKYEVDQRYFGIFECSECSQTWRSANAWYGFSQQCKMCGIWTEPKKLRPLLKNKGSLFLKPHLSELCGKCQSLGRDCSRR